MTGPAGAETTATIQATIDGRVVRVPAGTTILTAARDLGIDIPTLCHHETLSLAASCRLCVVEVEGRANLLPACATELTDGMVAPHRVRERRRGPPPDPRPAALRPPAWPASPASRPAPARCRSTATATASSSTSFEGEKRDLPIESDNPMIERDMNKCILCGKCVRVCQEVQVTDAIDFTERGFESQIAGVVRPPARHLVLPLLRPVRRPLPDRRPLQQAAQGRAHLGPHARSAPPARSAASAATSTSTSPAARSSASRPPTTPRSTRARCASRAASTPTSSRAPTASRRR